jgi:hypothetical protein
MDSYIRWLKETNRPLFEMAGTYWRKYQNALVPASLKPEPLELSSRQAHELLDRSGALFLRYFTRTISEPTDFWYTACNEYSSKKLPQKVRNIIRQGYRNCRVERVDPAWLADNGYPCYTAAFSRYRNAQPESKERFDEMCRGSLGGPFEFWAAFVGDQLAGFAKCAVDHDYAACLVLKLDPNFIRLNISSALKDTILSTYVSEQGKTAYAGFRSVIHQTNLHDFLLKHGYSRVFCDLKIVYRPTVRACVNLLYRCRSFVGCVPDSSIKRNIQGLLTQEEIRRSMELHGKPAIPPPFFERISRFVWGNRYGATEK